jgi:hypothetical protein
MTERSIGSAVAEDIDVVSGGGGPCDVAVGDNDEVGEGDDKKVGSPA